MQKSLHNTFDIHILGSQWFKKIITLRAHFSPTSPETFQETENESDCNSNAEVLSRPTGTSAIGWFLSWLSRRSVGPLGIVGITRGGCRNFPIGLLHSDGKFPFISLFFSVAPFHPGSKQEK